MEASFRDKVISIEDLKNLASVQRTRYISVPTAGFQGPHMLIKTQMS